MTADDGLAFASAGDWEAWLAQNHESSSELWLKIAKKASGIQSVSHAEALEVALAYGWIDSKRVGFDDDWFRQRFTPRGPRSRWSKINRESATRLIEEGRMKPAGLREVERAKADGRWDAAYDAQGTATVPDDLQGALDENEAARDLFVRLDSRNRYAILYRIQDAKRPETRARRIEKYVQMLGRGEKIYP